MALTKREIRPRKNKIRFTIVGTVIKTTDTAFLLQRCNSQTQYWIDNNEYSKLPSEGDIIECDIRISSYIGRKDAVFLYKLRYVGHRKLPALPDKDATSFFYKDLGPVEIIEFISSKEIEGLHVMKVNFLNTNEIFYLRYYQVEEGSLTTGKAKLTLELSTLTSVMGTDGVAYENKYMARWTNAEGKSMVKEKWTWYPTLVVTNIFKIEDKDAHGAGGDTENIQ